MSEPNYTLFAVSNRLPSEDYYCWQQWDETTKNMNRLVVEAVETPYVGLCDKAKFLFRCIKREYIKTKFVIVSDVWDLVFCTGAEEIISEFLKMDCDVAFSSEKNCFPDELKADFDKIAAPTEFKYLNSGIIVGYTDKIFEMLEAMKIEEVPTDYFDGQRNVHFVDQLEYMRAFIAQPVKIKLDYNQKLSRTLHNATLDELDFSKDRIRNISTDSYPCTIHFNGNGKSENNLRSTILKHLKLL